MRKRQWSALLGLAGWLAATAPASQAQPRPYIGYVYPAGGQQGTTVQVRLGGQGLEDLNQVLVTGSGVTAKVVEYFRRLNPQELTLLNAQLRELKRAPLAAAAAMAPAMTPERTTEQAAAVPVNDAETASQIAKLERRIREHVQNPACAAISALAMIEVTLAPDAEPGEREIRLATWRGVSNPLPFHVGQVPEFSRRPMITSTRQVLGKEAQALRKRSTNEVEDRITVPCTVNGQIASGEVNRHRFAARKGQRLVITAQGRQLIPYIADAVPGWFQPVLALYDAHGKELAYDDDYRFQPDPVILYQVPQDGEYVVAIHDSLYRGREDFVYRITLGELPFVTSIFPLGGRLGQPAPVKMKGWNLQGAELTPPAHDAAGLQWLRANQKGLLSNRVPFALDTLPEGLDREANNDLAHAQKVTLPIIINGRVDKPGDWDVFAFTGAAGETVVAEVHARRLDSPLDSVIKLTDAAGQLVALSDDSEDLGAGLNTHHADSYLMAKLPADGAYYLHLGDTARKGGEEYAYRLRLSAPRPDFALRVVPSSVSLRGKVTAPVTIHALRKDGFTGPIQLALKDPPAGFSAAPVTLSGTQAVARLILKSDLAATQGPVSLTVVGRAKIGGQDITHQAVPAEDRMQAFLWRHLVPASELKVLVFNPSYAPPPKRVARPRPPPPTPAPAAAEAAPATQSGAGTNAPAATAAPSPAKPQFTRQQIAGRLRQLKLLFEEGLLTDDFYNDKVAECEAAK